MKVTYDHHEHEHEFEPQTGLPERLPPGERVLWQGAPDWRAMAREAFHLRKLALYFGVILALRVGYVLSDGDGSTQAANDATRAVLMLLPLVLVALGVALGMAIGAARTTLYTITDKRIVMRIGIVLGLSFNLPLRTIANAGLRAGRDGVGDIPLALGSGDVIAFLHLWPHARPWRVAKPEPMLRCVPDAAGVARLLAQAWRHANGLSAVPASAAPSVAAPGEREVAMTGALS